METVTNRSNTQLLAVAKGNIANFRLLFTPLKRAVNTQHKWQTIQNSIFKCNECHNNVTRLLRIYRNAILSQRTKYTQWRGAVRCNSPCSTVVKLLPLPAYKLDGWHTAQCYESFQTCDVGLEMERESFPHWKIGIRSLNECVALREKQVDGNAADVDK